MEKGFILYFLIFASFIVFSRQEKVSIPDTSTNRYVKFYRFCSDENVYCRAGTRGPCGENQTLVEQVDQTSSSSDTFNCESFQNSDCTTQLDTNGTYTDVHQRGLCIWSHPDHPCYGYPISYRLYPEDGECYPVSDLSSQCKGFQEFYAVSETVGTCDCIVNERNETGYFYWSETNECYQLNSQGPCSAGEWFTLDSSGNPKCETTACPADGLHVLYSSGQQEPACYQLCSHEACQNESSDGKVLYRVQLFPEKFECTYPVVFAVAIATARTHTCQTGSKLSLSGQCKKTYV